MAKKALKKAKTRKPAADRAGRKNVRVKRDDVPATAFPDKTCQRLRALARRRQKAITEKARLIVVRDGLEEEIRKCTDGEAKKKGRLKEDWFDAVHAITEAGTTKKWAEDTMIETIEKADDLRLIEEPDFEAPEPPEAADEIPDSDDQEEGEENPSNALARHGADAAREALVGPDEVHWSQRKAAWLKLWGHEGAAELPKPPGKYFRDLLSNGIDSACAFVAAMRLNVKEGAPLLRSLEPQEHAETVLNAMAARMRADREAEVEPPEAFEAECAGLCDVLGSERLNMVADVSAPFFEALSFEPAAAG